MNASYRHPHAVEEFSKNKLSEERIRAVIDYAVTYHRQLNLVRKIVETPPFIDWNYPHFKFDLDRIFRDDTISESKKLEVTRTVNELAMAIITMELNNIGPLRKFTSNLN